MLRFLLVEEAPKNLAFFFALGLRDLFLELLDVLSLNEGLHDALRALFISLKGERMTAGRDGKAYSVRIFSIVCAQGEWLEETHVHARAPAKPWFGT